MARFDPFPADPEPDSAAAGNWLARADVGFAVLSSAEEDAMATMVKGTDEQLTQALGAGVVQIWSYLPPEIQHELFEEAVTCLGERMRHQLALFLHDRHVRTDLRARGMLEPDSLGG
jgi:predicted ATPase